jgi:hypothetical protein
MAGMKTEVRLPRSSTFHYISRTLETPPPMPSIPEIYKTPPHKGTLPKQVTAGMITARMVGDQGQNVLECFPSVKLSQVSVSTKSQGNQGLVPSSTMLYRTPSAGQHSGEEIVTALPTLPALPPTPTPGQRKPSRPFAVSHEGLSDTDVRAFLQVTDYMPALWWAGRFQTRFDQWRNEAMKAELDPSYKVEGLIGECKLDQDSLAACYVFLQLRELCKTNKAADSLWVSITSFLG